MSASLVPSDDLNVYYTQPLPVYAQWAASRAVRSTLYWDTTGDDPTGNLQAGIEVKLTMVGGPTPDPATDLALVTILAGGGSNRFPGPSDWSVLLYARVPGHAQATTVILSALVPALPTTGTIAFPWNDLYARSGATSPDEFFASLSIDFVFSQDNVLRGTPRLPDGESVEAVIPSLLVSFRATGGGSGGGGNATVSTFTYSDQDMQCPSDWENGFKEARVMSFGDGERSLSQLRTGDWQGSTFNVTLSDWDRSIRERLNSPLMRYWTEPLTIKIIDRESRGRRGKPYVVFVGPIIEAKPVQPLAFELTLGDIISSNLLSDQAQLPWRRIGDGFLKQLTQVAEGLDVDHAEPILYGRFIRHPKGAPSGEALRYSPHYVGILTIGIDYHVWLVAGHACADIIEWFVDDIPQSGASSGGEGDQWWAPHWPAWTDLFPDANFAEFKSDTYPTVTRRYTLLLGKVSDPTFLNPDAEEESPSGENPFATGPDGCARGDKKLTISLEGVEPNADGTGAVIVDRLLQYLHFTINYVANQGEQSYQSGAWLTNPRWSVFGEEVPIVDDTSYFMARDIALERFAPGYTGAGVIEQRRSLRDWLAVWNVSCSVRLGITKFGQLRIVMLHPTEVVKKIAPLLDDVNVILKDTFETEVLWSEHANIIPFKYDFDHATDAWLGIGSVVDQISIDAYGKAITGETREYLLAPGIVNAEHLATLEVRTARYPLRRLTLEAAVSSALCSLELGDYVRFKHVASVSAAVAQVRLGVIERHQVQAGKRRVELGVLDVEDLIDFDAGLGPGPVSPSPSPGSPSPPPVSPGSGSSGGSPEPPGPTFDRCTTAIRVPLTANVLASWDDVYNITAHTTDPYVSNKGIFPAGPNIAYHAAWFVFTAPGKGLFGFNTFGSNYDTQLSFLRGTCGFPWVFATYNDDATLEKGTSQTSLHLQTGESIYILAFGYSPDLGGGDVELRVMAAWTPDDEGGGRDVNDSCDTAIVMLPKVGAPQWQFYGTYDVTNNQLDQSVTGIGLFPAGPNEAFHAAWFYFPAINAAGNLSVVTTASNYDTQLAFLKGTCGGGWECIGYSDDMPPNLWSGATVNLGPEDDIYVLVFSHFHYTDIAGMPVTLRVTASFSEE